MRNGIWAEEWGDVDVGYGAIVTRVGRAVQDRCEVVSTH